MSHSKCILNTESELRKRKVRELQSKLAEQQSLFLKPTSTANAATEASLRVSHAIIKHKKSFQDGEMVKEAFVEAADALFQDFKNNTEIINAIKVVQLSQSSHTSLWGHGWGFDQATQKGHRRLWVFLTPTRRAHWRERYCAIVRFYQDGVHRHNDERGSTDNSANEETHSGEDIFRTFKNFVDLNSVSVEFHHNGWCACDGGPL